MIKGQRMFNGQSVFNGQLFDNKKKNQKNQMEDYYKILGTTAKAGQDKIKERYFEKIREFPPETHPEEFQQIRKAYETLKNPDQRRKYDRERKFGSKIEKEMELALNQLLSGDQESAHKRLSRVIEMDPDYANVYLIKAELYLTQKNWQDFDHYFEQAMPKIKPDELADFSCLKVHLLTKYAFLEEAKQALNVSKEKYPEYESQHKQLAINIYKGLRDYEMLWQAIASQVPPIKETSPDDIYLLIDWLIASLELDKKKESSQIISRIKKLIRLIEDDDEREYLLDVLMDEYYAYFNVVRFEEAALFIELVVMVDKNDKELQQLKKEASSLAALDAAIRRVDQDFNLVPYVRVLAMKFFYEKHEDEPNHELEKHYQQVKAEFEQCNEEVAWSILQIKKRYPLVYKTFQSEWEALFANHTAGMNRETKRRLR